MSFRNLLYFFVISAVMVSLLPARSTAEKANSPNPRVYVKTNIGSFTIELFEKEAPATVKNFLNYTEKKFYHGTTFHRVMKNFMIQGGGFTPEGHKKLTGPGIKNEAENGLKNLKCTVAMARTREPHSATSQFFINMKDNPGLDFTETTLKGYGYAVFGKIVEGWDEVEKIRNVAVKANPDRPNEISVPLKPVVIKSIRRIFPEDEEKE